MWIFTSKSFVSVVLDLNDPSRRLVRARFAGDIEELFPDAVVREGEGTDYRYRASVPAEEVAQRLADYVRQIEYGNFKDSLPPDHWDRHAAYMEVWQTMYAYQKKG